MKLIEITRYLESRAPLSLQESYDNSGLLIGDPEMDIHGALVCLDSIEEVIDEAISKGLNLVIAHHPIVFSGLKRFTGKTYIERVVMKAIRHNIALYAIHTNLDNVLDGVNGKIAALLGLENARILDEKKELLYKLHVLVPKAQAESLANRLFEAGAGHIGNYSECSFSSEGTGSFKANEQANPHIGTKGERHYEAETKIEVILAKWQINQVLAAMHKHHPYEEVAYDLLALENQSNQFGSGIVGELAEPMDSMAALQYVKEKLGVSVIKHTPIATPTEAVEVFCFQLQKPQELIYSSHLTTNTTSFLMLKTSSS
jgi:dinuclear metal center YbgI/SA1388 family protein